MGNFLLFKFILGFTWFSDYMVFEQEISVNITDQTVHNSNITLQISLNNIHLECYQGHPTVNLENLNSFLLTNSGFFVTQGYQIMFI